MAQIKKFNEYFSNGEKPEQVEEAKAQWNDITYNISVDVEDSMSSVFAKLSKKYTKFYKGKKLEFSTWKGDARLTQGTGVVEEVIIKSAFAKTAPMDMPFAVDFKTEGGKTFYNISHIEEL